MDDRVRRKPGRPGKSSKKALKAVLIVLGVIVAVAVAAAIGAYAYYRHVFSGISLPDTVVDVIPPGSDEFETDEGGDPWFVDDTGESSSPAGENSGGTDVPPVSGGDTSAVPGSTTFEEKDPVEIVWPDDLAPLGDDGLINIMLVGQDNGNFSKRGRSDSMILLSVNPKSKQIAMVSFLRDMYVQIGNGYADNRLNVAYKFGGFPLMFDVMKLNFGITCDYGIVVNFDSFKSIIDILGGVDLTFTEAEVKYLTEKCGVGKMPDGGMIKEGLNKKVPSETALAYARIRKIDSDFSRAARQRKVILSIYNSLKGASLSKILDLVNRASDFVRIYGMSSGELISLVSSLYPLLGGEIDGYVVPAKGEYTNVKVRGMAVLLPKLEKIRESLGKKLPIG
ncbi:MAG: LCP family protein [Clostridia bacterium]|nr:LCP family protein [Clostridia bacterium]